MLSGIIGKRVKFPCGTAAVMEEFEVHRCHCAIQHGKVRTSSVDARAGRPALLFEYCPGCWKNHHWPWGRARAADGRNVCAVKLMYTVFWMCFVFVRAFSLSFFRRW